jgi:hypothetical protein
MNSSPVVALMARESTRRKLSAPQPEPGPSRRPRRAVAVVLQAAAHRLDPWVASPPRADASA